MATRQDIRFAAEHLSESAKGLSTMQFLLDWFTESHFPEGIGDQQAVLTLLDGAWGKHRGTVIDCLHEFLGQ